MAESDGYNSPFDYSSSEEEGRVAAYFPDDFKQYVVTQLNRCPVVHHVDYDSEDADADADADSFCGWVFCSREDDQSEHLPNILDLKKRIEYLLQRCLSDWLGYPALLQFWAPKITTMDGRSYLTTQNQPFALCTFDGDDDDVEGPVKGLCGYRMISKDYKFYMDRESSDEQLGVPGRVFNHGFPELTPNVEYYSIKEYPLRDHALRCQVAQSWAIPLFDISTHLCVGVLEMVSTPPSRGWLSINYYVWEYYLKEVGLESSISYADHHTDFNVRHNEALDEINKVLKVVCKDHGLLLAQAWAPCEVDCTCRALVRGDIFHVICDFSTSEYWQFNGVSDVSHLRKGQGVVGRAFSSPNVLFCKDVTQLSIVDFPLAHYAQEDKLGCCFAICLQRSCTGNDIYVLECFMPPSNKEYVHQQTALRKILETMKKNFQTFKLASGEELGEHLYIEEIPFQNGEKLDSVQMSQATKSLPRLEPLQSGGEMTHLYIEEIPFQNGEKLDSVQMSQATKSLPRLEPLQSGGEMTHLYIEEIPFQNGEKLDSVQMFQATKSLPRLEPLQTGGEMTQLDLSNQQSMDALNNESNVVSVERGNIDVTCSQEKGKTKRPKRVYNKTGVKIEIPLDDILQNSKKRIQAAADDLKVSRSTLKRVCRGYGFPRWPPRKKNMVGQYQPSESSLGVDHQQISQLSFDLPFNQASATVVHTNPHNIAIEDANIVTMRAKYINDITIKFRLSLSSGLVELQQQIAKRLHLEVGSYSVKYKDEEDHVILIACDDDLQDCISTYRLLGTSIMVSIDPK